MLYSVVKVDTPHNTYNRLTKKFQEGASSEEIYKEIEEYCSQCKPSNPMACVESCEIWKIKEESKQHIKRDFNGISATEIINVIKNSRRIEILRILSRASPNLTELQQKIKEKGYCHSHTTISHYIEPLIYFHLMEKDGDTYKLTEVGRKLCDESLSLDVLRELPENSKGYEEAILKMLNDREGTYEELKGVPRTILPRVLKRLKNRGLIVRVSPAERIFYYAAKRRPTRRLSPTESRIFYALPKNGISVKELSKRVGINGRRTYKYLRRLMYRRHVSKYKRNATYAITPKGTQLVESLNNILNITQEKSPLKLA